MKNSFKKYFATIRLCNDTQELASAFGVIKTALESGELSINEYEVLESNIKNLYI